MRWTVKQRTGTCRLTLYKFMSTSLNFDLPNKEFLSTAPRMIIYVVVILLLVLFDFIVREYFAKNIEKAQIFSLIWEKSMKWNNKN